MPFVSPSVPFLPTSHVLSLSWAKLFSGKTLKIEDLRTHWEPRIVSLVSREKRFNTRHSHKHNLFDWIHDCLGVYVLHLRILQYSYRNDDKWPLSAGAQHILRSDFWFLLGLPRLGDESFCLWFGSKSSVFFSSLWKQGAASEAVVNSTFTLDASENKRVCFWRCRSWWLETSRLSSIGFLWGHCLKFLVFGNSICSCTCPICSINPCVLLWSLG